MNERLLSEKLFAASLVLRMIWARRTNHGLPTQKLKEFQISPRLLDLASICMWGGQG
jgi:hypothetical protein